MKKKVNNLNLFINSFCIFLSIMSLSSNAKELGKTTQFISESKFQEIVNEKPNIDPECEEDFEDQDLNAWLQKVKVIKLDLNEERFFKKILKKYKYNDGISNQSKREWSDYHSLEVQFNNSLCKHNGKYRLTGDLYDHGGKGGAILHSIKIKLKNARINNITKFKLLVPQTRSSENELLNVLIHKKMGFIAPRTAMIKVQIAGQTFDAIFQEDISKELLEKNNLHDGIIIEGDEGNQDLTNPRIINTKFLTSSSTHTIAKDVLNLIAPVYLNSNRLSIINNYNSYPLSIDFLPKNSQDRFKHFHLLNFALKNSGGLSRDDHRIAYDRISREFFPIYYDGHHKQFSHKDVNFIFSKSHTDFVLKNLHEISIEDLSYEVKAHGANIENYKISRFINNAIIYLEKVKVSNIYLKQKDVLEEFNEQLFLKKITNLIDKDVEISWKNNDNEIKICIVNTYKFECELKKVESSFFTKNSIFEPQGFEKGIFIHGFLKNKKNKEYFASLNKNSIPIKNTKTIIEHTSNILPIIDNDNKIIYITRSEFNNKAAQVRISGGTLKNWKLVADEESNLGYKRDDMSRFSEFGLTGCVTFNDINLINMNINLSNTECEDAVHFVRSSGNISNLNILNAKSDAIDADFSRLLFDEIKIRNTGNDCIDLSSGSYLLKKVQLSFCTDKGISSGENALVNVNNLIMDQVLFGIVSKDSSVIKVNSAIIKNAKLCLSAYRKKQEYGGGMIFINNYLDCNDSPSYIQKKSKIEFSY